MLGGIKKGVIPMKPSILIQSFKQMWGIIKLEQKYKGKLPDKDSYSCSIKYSLPFQGIWTVVNGGVTQIDSHSWDIPTQRYAYDFIILDKNGKSFNGDETKPESFYCYGKEIFAPADGVVIEVSDWNPDSKITVDRRAACAARDIRGNYILIHHAKDEYSLLAHLKPNSINVSVGQRVNRGEKIALCGNSGNSSVNQTPNYELFDNRKIQKEDINTYPPYISRGQSVSNI